MLRRHGQIFCVLSVVFDVSLIVVAWLICYVVRFRLGLLPYKEAMPPGVAQFARLLPMVVCCDLIFVALSGLYRPEGRRSLLAEQWQLVRAAVFGWLGLIAALYYYRSVPYSRLMLFMFFFANPLALVASRSLLRRTLALLGRSGWGVQHVAILGTGKLARETLHELRNSRTPALQVDYLIDDADERQEGDVAGVPILGSLADMTACLGEHLVDAVLIALRSSRLD
ncbi:MAG: nucleoside-diphosphate sugar epimerase/dehydratase, partial [Planctomycetota bacterium]